MGGALLVHGVDLRWRVDAEAAWVEGARERVAPLGLGDRAVFQTGTAESLPWPDDSLDMVT